MRITSFILSFFLLICMSAQLAGQSEADKLSNQLNKLSGSKHISTAFRAAELYMDAGNFDEAIKMTEKAEREAKKIGQKETMALIYQKKAELIIQRTPSVKKYSDKAYKALKSSLENTKTRSVEQENVDLLYDLLPRVKDNKLSNRISKLLSQTNSRIEGYEIAAANKNKEEEERAFKKRSKSELFDDFEELESEKERLENERNTISQERTLLAKSVVDLEKATSNLNNLISSRQRQINQMTKKQQEAEAVIEFNKRMVDSLKFEAWRDSVALTSQQALIERQEQDIVFQEQELQLANTEIQLRDSQRKLYLALGGIVLLLAGLMFWRFKEMKKYNDQLEAKNEIIKAEMLKSDKLLLNILPADVASELKTNGKVKTQFFDSATVLFSDFVQFSKIAASVSAEDLIEELDFIFSEFDKILKKHNVEKIKTIGDAYMCVGGVPKKSDGHAKRVANVAFEMQEFLETYNQDRKAKDLPEFQTRIGLHSGSLIAGVVGTSKFVYDVWGDTVNAADRMQSAGKAGLVNVSAATYELLKDEFEGEYRGKLQIKNMNDMEAYFISQKEQKTAETADA